MLAGDDWQHADATTPAVGPPLKATYTEPRWGCQGGGWGPCGLKCLILYLNQLVVTEVGLATPIPSPDPAQRLGLGFVWNMNGSPNAGTALTGATGIGLPDHPGDHQPKIAFRSSSAVAMGLMSKVLIRVSSTLGVRKAGREGP